MIHHVGRSHGRTKDKCHHGRIEKIFADAWIETNNPPAFLNDGHGTLAWLVGADDNRVRREPTQEEATCAATVVQWMGSPVGWSWLTETLEKAGYEISERKQKVK